MVCHENLPHPQHSDHHDLVLAADHADDTRSCPAGEVSGGACAWVGWPWPRRWLLPGRACLWGTGFVSSPSPVHSLHPGAPRNLNIVTASPLTPQRRCCVYPWLLGGAQCQGLCWHEVPPPGPGDNLLPLPEQCRVFLSPTGHTSGCYGSVFSPCKLEIDGDSVSLSPG